MASAYIWWVLAAAVGAAAQGTPASTGSYGGLSAGGLSTGGTPSGTGTAIKASGVAGGSSSGGTAGKYGQAGPSAADMYNIKYYIILMLIFGSIVGIALIYRTVLYLVQYVRTLACINNNAQQY